MPTSIRQRFLAVALVAVATLYGLAIFATTAQNSGAQAASATPTLADDHPVSIHGGTCANLSQEPEIAIGIAGPIGGDAAGTVNGSPVLATEATIKRKLDDLTNSGEPYAIVAHQSEITAGPFLACGDIGGPVKDGKLVVALQPLNGSGVSGIAIFDTDKTGILGLGREETQVQVYLIDDVASPAAAGAPAPASGEATPAAATPAPSTEPTQAPTAAAAGTPIAGQAENAVTINLQDIAFQPNQITIPANTPVTVTLTNSGAADHNFSLNSHGNKNLPAGQDQSVDLSPGQSQTITLNLPAGTYYFYCDVPGHEAAGMRGNIIVQDGASIATAEATVAAPTD